MVRPLSALNIRASKLSNLKTNDKYEENKIIFNDKNQIDLDLLFERQLQKLRDINKEYESKDEINENKNNLNFNMDNNFKDLNLNIMKKNENKKNIYCNNEKNSLFFDNINNKNKTLDIRPSSHYLKKNNSLPRILSPKYNKRKIFQQEEYNSKIAFHKDFGKVPKYIQDMKIKAEILKEIQNKKKRRRKISKRYKIIV